MNFLLGLIATLGFILGHPLAARRRWAAFSNFVRWQLGARLLAKSVVVPWVDDAKFIVAVGETGLTGNLYGGLMEYEDMLFLLHALRPGDTFVDVGANVGAYTILASKVVGSASIAFEPLPATVDRLRDQVQINRIETLVDVRNMGVGHERGALHFTNDGDTVNRVSPEGEAPNTTRVAVSTLDDELLGDESYLLKIDVEGFEFNVIQGAARTLSSGNVAAIIIELNESGQAYGHSNQEIHQLLASFGFTAASYDPVGRSLTRLDHFNHSRGNTIYVRDIGEVAERCRTASQRTIHTAGSRRL